MIDLAGIRLRPLRADDADALFAYLSDPAVTVQTGFPEITTAFVEGMIEKSRGRWTAGEPAKWGIVIPPEDRVIGTVGFNEWSPAHRWAELAYDLARPHWGTGVIRRTVAEVLKWIFEWGDVDRVHAYVRVDNERSTGLLERLGFVREGCLRSFRVCRGVPKDFFVYAVLRDEWRADPPC